MSWWILGCGCIGLLCLKIGWILTIVQRKNDELRREQFPGSDYQGMCDNLISHAEEEAAKLRA